jgi:Domain of unknown function (DUF4272)
MKTEKPLLPDIVSVPDILSEEEIIASKEMQVASQKMQVASKEIRAESLRFLEQNNLARFPEAALPFPDLTRTLRSRGEMVGRALAMQTLFLYVSLTEDQETSEALQEHAKRNYLSLYWTPEEQYVFNLPRTEATTQYQGFVGWLLEGLWSLAWVLGYPQKPTIAQQEIPTEVARDIFLIFLPAVGTLLDDFFHTVTVRPVDEAITLEDRLFCAHHALFLSQKGGNVLSYASKARFYDSIIAERRQALQWCLTPQKPWGG